MMEVDEVTIVSEESSAVAFEERRGLSPWVIFGALLFVFMFIVGWRSAGNKKPPRPRDIVLPPLDAGESTA
ncbi:MAG: hypothetical protein M3R44_02940 [Candidatus Eremiobacteraeota bacterium]|nr:hypothetical protein [Candidatus Eremiobacteraeota bacterium]